MTETQFHNSQAIQRAAAHLVAQASQAGLVVTIETLPQLPLAMGNYSIAVNVREARHAPAAPAEPLGMFGHHPDPAIDFVAEVEAIEAERADLAAGLPPTMDLQARTDRAMTFRVGGDAGAVAAKNALFAGIARPQQHRDDKAVDAFAAAMKAKLAQARSKGRSGWDDPAALTMESLALDLRKHVGKGDPVDVANYAMMIHQRGGSTRLPALSQDLLQAIKNAPAGATVIEWGGSPIFISRDAPDSAPSILLSTDNDQRDLQAEVASIKHLAGEIRLQLPAGAEVPQDLESGMQVDLLYTPAVAIETGGAQ